jgi:CBS domain-containing protein
MAGGTSFEPRNPARPVRVVSPHSPVAALVLRPALAVDESCPIADAVEVMRDADVSALVVGSSIGVVTERDVARALAAGRAPADPVGLIAAPHPLTVSGETTVLVAAEVMLNEEVRHLLISLSAGTVGVVSIRDVLAVLVQAVDPHLWLTSLRLAFDSPTEIWLG